ncbi:unnamed protein product [Enterobius vermicularis]|uniref:CACTA en-spm transposon protein n=1 Tax=Enterobius vermicularis TaxID=51028 RepID=A0A0N4UTC9_ENTVE|nr:unnamed protein product [Enterobius vermicularis]
MVEFGECIDETFGGSPKNIYHHHDFSTDSAIGSGASSRRNSNNPFGELRDFVKRRKNVNGRVGIVY